MSHYINGLMVMIVLVLLLHYGIRTLWYFDEELLKQHQLLLAEQAKSEALLYNMLPATLVHELKTTGKSPARKFNQVSLLFTDFVGFTQSAAKQSPQTLVEELNGIFTAFDNILEQHGCERIKTLGDSYWRFAA